MCTFHAARLPWGSFDAIEGIVGKGPVGNYGRASSVGHLLESGERADISGLIVTEHARRSGTGQALVRAAEEWARRQGLNRMVVRSSVSRLESHPFYERLGYDRAKTQHAYTKQLG